MKVLIVPSWYPTDRYPGGGVFCREQALALNADARFYVFVLFVDRMPVRDWLHVQGKRRGLRQEHGVRIYRLPMPRLPLLWMVLYPLWTLYGAIRLSRYGFRPELIHAHVAVPAGLGAVLLGKLLGVPVVVTEHTSPFSMLMRNPVAAFATCLALRSADRVVAVSRSLRTEILSYPQLRRNIEIVPNVVDVVKIAASKSHTAHDKPLRLLFVGEMETRRKGVSYLLKAVLLLRQRGVNVVLDLVGGGRRQAQYEARAHRLGVASVCRFHGAVPHGEVMRFFSRAQLFVLPSLAESFGVVLIEAMAAGIPVVATRSGGPEEIVTDDVGTLVPPRDPQALAAAIEEIIPRLDDFSSSRLRSIAEERYGQAALAERLFNLYKEVIRQ